MRRLFIAIEIEDNTKKQICELLNNIKKRLPEEKIVDCDKLHITILFLGDTNIDIEKIIETIDSVKFSREIQIKGLDAFYYYNRPKVLFLKVTTNLNDIHDELCNKLKIADKRFSPHITISRLKYTKDISELIKTYGSFEFKFISNGLTLFNSDFKNYQKIYSAD